MRALFLTMVATGLSLPARAEGQAIADLLAGIRDGGAWVGIPIQQGRGAISSTALPTAGLTLAGCLHVWPGHSGLWEIRAHDQVTDRTVELNVSPGVGAPFAHAFGMRAQVDLDFRWSEPRDTTLILWVGLELGGEASEEACEPRYRAGSSNRSVAPGR